MADVQPLRALHYDLARTGGLEAVAAPPYDVIDPHAARGAGRALAVQRRRRSTSPRRPTAATPTSTRRRCSRAGRARGRDRPRRRARALGARAGLHRPRRPRRTRRGFFARVRVEDYGPGRIRPHERTHPGPQEDRLRLTRATKANLSPIFSLYDDPDGRRVGRARAAPGGEPWGELTDDDGTRHRLWRVADPGAVARRPRRAGRPRAADRRRPPPLRDRARSTRTRSAARGDHRYVLMCLVALQDPGLTVFPTHRLLSGLDDRPPRGAARRRRPRLGGRRRGPRRARAGRAGRRPGAARLPRRPSTSARSGSRCRTRRSPTRRSPTCPSPTAGSTPRCSRRSSSRARSG